MSESNQDSTRFTLYRLISDLLFSQRFPSSFDSITDVDCSALISMHTYNISLLGIGVRKPREVPVGEMSISID
jgi:hypothetical protein